MKQNKSDLKGFISVPPQGTGFNPDYMSTPPPGLIPAVRFHPDYISTPPPGAVHFGPEVTGGKAYTGGDYVPPKPSNKPGK